MEIKINNSYFQGEKTVMSGIMSNVDGDICHFTFGVNGDKSNFSDSEKIKSLLDTIYSKLYPNRAETEAISNLNKELATIKQEYIAEVQKELDKVKELVKNTTLIVNTLLEGVEEDDSRDNDTSESSNNRDEEDIQK